MKPAPLHYFLAKPWPWLALFWGVPLFVITIFADEAYLHHGSIFIEGIFGSGLGLALAFGLVVPARRYCGRRNGAPFCVGQEVVVLCGKHRDSRGRIHQIWPETRHVRLRLETQHSDEEDHIFSFLEILQVQR